jgi:cytochrome P450
VAQARLSSASLLENARFNALVIVPNALQGLFRRRPAAVAAATRANVDGHAIGLLRGMARKHAGGPLWVRVVRDQALLLLTPADVHRALHGSPDPFAADPPAKRDGMVTFQPDALTISRGPDWASRRRFTEAVLDTREPPHRLADRFAAVAAEEAERLIAGAEADGDGRLDWDRWNAAFARLTRRVVLGDAAADDEAVTGTLAEMMAEANGMPGRPSERHDAFIAMIEAYVEAAEEGSLASLFADAPADERTRPSGQIAHWLFATADTLAINAFRALALLASHPTQRARALAEPEYMSACLQDAMRLWPTTPMLSRETLSETDWRGVEVPAGTQVLIPNTYLHRDPDRHEYENRFSPERWLDGSAASEWSFNHFSRGPQGCPGVGVALLLGRAMLAEVIDRRGVELERPRLDSARPLPVMLDFFGLRLRLAQSSNSA